MSIQKENALYFEDKDNFKDLVAQMPEPHRGRYNKFGHHRIEAVFKNRVFIIFKPTGKHGSPASGVEVIDIVRVVNIDCDFESGLSIEIKNQKGASQIVGYVPSALFESRIFVSIPSNFLLRWDAREHKGVILRSLVGAILIKTKNKVAFRSVGNLYMETHNVFQGLFPEVSKELQLKIPLQYSVSEI